MRLHSDFGAGKVATTTKSIQNAGRVPVGCRWSAGQNRSPTSEAVLTRFSFITPAGSIGRCREARKPGVCRRSMCKLQELCGMTEDDELGYTEKVWVFRAALDRDAAAARQSGCATVWLRDSLAARQSGCATVPWRGCRGGGLDGIRGILQGRPEQKPRAAF